MKRARKRRGSSNFLRCPRRVAGPRSEIRTEWHSRQRHRQLLHPASNSSVSDVHAREQPSEAESVRDDIPTNGTAGCCIQPATSPQMPSPRGSPQKRIRTGWHSRQRHRRLLLPASNNASNALAGEQPPEAESVRDGISRANLHRQLSEQRPGPVAGEFVEVLRVLRIAPAVVFVHINPASMV